MKNKKISSRYALALLNIAQKNGQLDETLKDITFFSQHWQEKGKVRFFLANPDFTKKEKERFIKNSFSTLFSDVFLNFLYLLINKNRLGYLPEINEDYKKIYYKLKGIEEVNVVLAHDIDKPLLNKLEAGIKALINRKIKLNVEIDPEILGGVSVHFKDQVIDGSLKHNLGQLKESLLAVKIS